MPVRVAVLEEKTAILDHWPKIVAALLSFVIAAGIAWGSMLERVDNVRDDVRETRAEIQGLRQDLNARGQVPSSRSGVTY